MSVTQATIEPRNAKLFGSIEDKFKTSEIDTDKWYLVVLSAIATTPAAHLSSQLYLYLTNQPAYSTSDARGTLIRRMREVLLKDIALLGFPRPAEALIKVTEVVSDDDGESSFSRRGWKCDEENHRRGMRWLELIYAHNAKDLFGLFETHPDFAFWLSDITYGLLLSDRQVLGDLDTEMVVLAAVMGQDIPRMTYWHIRGARRLGISKEAVQMIIDCVKLVVEAGDVTLKHLPKVDDVDGDLVGA